jgi:hypothetical protein
VNEFINQLLVILRQIEENFDDLSDEEAQSITDFLNQATTFISTRRSSPERQMPGRTIDAPIPLGTDLLWQLAGGQPNAFVSYLRDVPDPALNALLQDPEILNSIIEHLQINQPIERNGEIDGIEQAPLQSSNVYGFRFNPQSKKLQVRFHGGSVYEYDGVPDVIFSLFANGNANAKTNGKNQYGAWWRGKNPSLGAALNQYIKQGGYTYRRLR